MGKNKYFLGDLKISLFVRNVDSERHRAKKRIFEQKSSFFKVIPKYRLGDRTNKQFRSKNQMSSFFSRNSDSLGDIAKKQLFRQINF